MTAERRRKVIVIGSRGHSGVACVPWELHKVPNLKDFDVVVINSQPLIPIMAKLTRTKDKEQRQAWDYYQRRTADQLLGLLKSGGQIHVLLYPREYLKLSEPPYVRAIDNTRWLPLEVSLDFEEGDTVIVRAPAFARYFDKVRRWTYTFAASDRASNEGFYDTPIATNRAGEAIALSIVCMGAGGREGFLCLLPPPTEVTVDEAICIILEDLCGMQARTPPPAWLDTIKAPGEEAADAEIEDARAALAKAQDQLGAAETGKAELTQFKEILYETGAPLQETVRKTFEVIGIRTAHSPVSDEFMLVNEEPILVEVTGGGKSIAGRDLSQLIKDMGNYLAQTEQPIKGVLVGNAWRDVPPNERDTKDRPIFPDNVIKTANNHSIALLSTIELFNAYCAAKEGRLSGEQAMKRIRDNSGVISLLG